MPWSLLSVNHFDGGIGIRDFDSPREGAEEESDARTMTFTPWRELLARADEALARERKAEALAEPLALLESMMQRMIRKWAVQRRHHMKWRARSREALSIPIQPATPGRIRAAPSSYAGL